MHPTSCIFWTLPRCPGDDYAPWCAWWQGPEWLSHPHPVPSISLSESGSVFLLWALPPWEGDWCLGLARTARKLSATSAWIDAIPASESEKRNCVYRGSIVCTGILYWPTPDTMWYNVQIRLETLRTARVRKAKTWVLPLLDLVEQNMKNRKQIPMATNSFPGFLQHVFLHIELTVVKFQILSQRKASPECPQACCL